MICTVCDDFVPELRWIVELSNGLTVYQDDGRPGLEPASAWIRLKSYLQEYSLVKIEKFRIEFRSHIEYLPDRQEGYYFSLGVGATWGGSTDRHFNTGILVGDEIRIITWKVPELIVFSTETRKKEQGGQCLIY